MDGISSDMQPPLQKMKQLPLQAVHQFLTRIPISLSINSSWSTPDLRHSSCELLQSSPHAVHVVPPALHKGQHGLDDGHEPCQGILDAMESPDGLSCIAQDEDVPSLPSPGLLADWIFGGACKGKGSH